MLWVGITGSMGSGKSSVSEILKKSGYPLISADDVSRQMSSKGSPGLAEIEKAFGSSVIDSNGELDRPSLSKLVFGHPEKLKKLEAILHPLIQGYVGEWRSRMAAQGSEVAFYDIPLLFENNLKTQFDKVICVTANEDLIVERVKARSGLGREEVLKRLSHQVPVSEKVRQSDIVIENNGSMEDLEVSVNTALKKLIHQPQE